MYILRKPVVFQIICTFTLLAPLQSIQDGTRTDVIFSSSVDQKLKEKTNFHFLTIGQKTGHCGPCPVFFTDGKIFFTCAHNIYVNDNEHNFLATRPLSKNLTTYLKQNCYQTMPTNILVFIFRPEGFFAMLRLKKKPEKL